MWAGVCGKNMRVRKKICVGRGGKKKKKKKKEKKKERKKGKRKYGRESAKCLKMFHPTPSGSQME